MSGPPGPSGLTGMPGPPVSATIFSNNMYLKLKNYHLTTICCTKITVISIVYTCVICNGISQ